MFYEILINLSIIMNIIMVFSILYLFKWRKSLDKKSIFIVSKDFEEQILNLKKSDSKILKDNTESFKILAETISKKDEEIKQFKEGYDLKILNRFKDRFLRIYRIIEEDILFYEQENNTETLRCLKNIQDIFEDFLLEIDVESFVPKIGADYKTAYGVSHNPKRIITKIQDDNMRIANIKNKGFKINDKILSPAVVSVYKYKKGA